PPRCPSPVPEGGSLRSCRDCSRLFSFNCVPRLCRLLDMPCLVTRSNCSVAVGALGPCGALRAAVLAAGLRLGGPLEDGACPVDLAVLDAALLAIGAATASIGVDVERDGTVV